MDLFIKKEEFGDFIEFISKEHYPNYMEMVKDFRKLESSKPPKSQEETNLEERGRIARKAYNNFKKAY